VLFSPSEKFIYEVLERKNIIHRPLIANIDNLILFFAAKSPDLDFTHLYTLILNSFYHNINPYIVINKFDLLTYDEKINLENLLVFLKNINIPFLFISTYDNYNIDILENEIKDKIIAFAGPSGAGKSSLINKIQSEEILETSDVSRKIKRGKHTTKQTKLLKLKVGGYVADTPGFSAITIPNIKDFNEYISLFPDFESLIDECQFSNCKHINEPICGVKNFFKDNKIIKTRYDFYVNTYNQLVERWNNYYG